MRVSATSRTAVVRTRMPGGVGGAEPRGSPLFRSVARSAASNRAEQCPLCPNTSDFDLLSDGKRIIDLDSEISDGTFHFLVAKQKLDRTQVAGPTVDQGRLRAAERVRGKDVRVQSDARDPFCDEPRVLPCCHGLTNPPAAGEQTRPRSRRPSAGTCAGSRCSC